ncbi:MAG: hypothetical protein KDJ36_08635 [Hyphomicrobiaceae bacterium]|nr:hypothetical protein [Hyphomicrobiaceae bacterium]
MAEATYCHHRIDCAPRQWKAVADRIAAHAGNTIGGAGGKVYGIWRSQIGRPRDELNAITVWPTATTSDAVRALTAGVSDVVAHDVTIMRPTLRPLDTVPPTRQGNYAFRWFETPRPNWDEFLELCAGAWPGFEAAYDSQVIGLWRFDELAGANIKSLMVTRRPDLAMWERTKIPQGDAEAEVRSKLSRRYDLCDWTVVHTSTLITAADREDTARWT